MSSISFDHKIKIPNNAHTIIEFEIPYAIPVPDDIYKIKTKKGTVEINTKRIQRKLVSGMDVSRNAILSIGFDKYGRSGYSQIQMKFPYKMKFSKRKRSPNMVGKAIPRLEDKEKVLRCLNDFIEAIKNVTNEFWVEPIRYQDMISFQVFYWYQDKRYPSSVHMLDTGVGGVKISTGEPHVLTKTQRNELKELLQRKKTIDNYMIFIMNAKDAFVQENYRLGILEAVIALEIVFFEFIKKEGEKRNIKESRMKSLITDVGIHDGIDTVYKLFIGDRPQIDEKVVRSCKSAISIRNKIMHSGLRDVRGKETEERIIDIEIMIDHLKSLK